VILDGHGEVRERLRVTRPDGTKASNYTAVIPANVWGDAREELLIAGRECFNIHANGDLLLLDSLCNASFYRGL
jgi:hypothetical protein